MLESCTDSCSDAEILRLLGFLAKVKSSICEILCLPTGLLLMDRFEGVFRAKSSGFIVMIRRRGGDEGGVLKEGGEQEDWRLRDFFRLLEVAVDVSV